MFTNRLPTPEDFTPHRQWCGQDVYACPDCGLEIVGGDGTLTGAQRMAVHARIHVTRTITTSPAPFTATVPTAVTPDVTKPKWARSSETAITPDTKAGDAPQE